MGAGGRACGRWGPCLLAAGRACLCARMPLADAELTLGTLRGCNEAYPESRDRRAEADGPGSLPGLRGCAGPFIVDPTQDRLIGPDYLQGRFFQSSIYAAIISGTYGHGIPTTISYVLDEPAID